MDKIVIKNKLIELYKHQAHYGIGDDLENAFNPETECGNRINVMYSLLSNFGDTDNGYISCMLLSSDGGVKNFLAFYYIGDLGVLIGNFTWHDTDDFKTLDIFVDWLHDKIEKIDEIETKSDKKRYFLIAYSVMINNALVTGNFTFSHTKMLSHNFIKKHIMDELIEQNKISINKPEAISILSIHEFGDERDFFNFVET